MSPEVHGFISVNLLPMLTGTLAAVTCGVLGNFLVLRRLSLMGDAISHSVLPGLVVAFLVAGTRASWPMFVGAALAGVATVVLVEVVKKLGRVESGAAMGVVFSILFALGVLLLERAAARHVDLDADCVLHGQLETLFWFPPDTWAALFSWETLGELPRETVTLSVMLVLAVALVVLLFKELRIAAFDPALATTQGYPAGVLHYVLMVFVAAATVASFEAVGSILVIAMLICPAATARLLTDKLSTQIALSVVVAVLCGVGGYWGATAVPAALGPWLPEAVAVPDWNAAGTMAVAGGVFLGVAALASPSHGVIAKAWRRKKLGRSIALEDLLTTLYRFGEQGRAAVDVEALRPLLPAAWMERALIDARRVALVEETPDGLALTASGQSRARDLVRRHRLWETYLVDHTQLRADHVHEPAEQFEHVAVEPPTGPVTDPHGRDIPSGSRAE